MSACSLNTVVPFSLFNRLSVVNSEDSSPALSTSAYLKIKSFFFVNYVINIIRFTPFNYKTRLRAWHKVLFSLRPASK